MEKQLHEKQAGRGKLWLVLLLLGAVFLYNASNGNPAQQIGRLFQMIWKGMPGNEEGTKFEQADSNVSSNQQHSAYDGNVADFYKITPSETLPLAIGAAAGLLLGTAGFILSKMKDDKDDDRGFRSDSSSTLSHMDPVAIAFWLTPSVAFIASVWTFVFNPKPMLAVFPAWFSRYQGLNDVIPLHPKNLVEAFQLGALFQKVQVAGANVSEILGEVTRVVGRTTPVLLEQVMGLEQEIALLVEDRGIISRMIGIFSFINIVWFVGILLIVVAAGPILCYIGKPIRKILILFCKKMILFCEKIIVPFLVAIQPMYPYLATALGLMFITEGSRYPTDAYSMSATMISITGLVIAAFNYGLCTRLYAPLYLFYSNNEEVLLQLFAALATAALVPVAVSTQSTLIGTAAVLAGTTVLGFSFVCYGCCYCFGFRNDLILRTAYSCLSLNVLFTLAKAFNLQPLWIRPFAGPVAAVGGSVYFLALLCFSARYYGWLDSRLDNSYLLRQVPMLVSLAAFYAVGTTYGIPAMVNVAHVYLVLYGCEKYADAAADLESGMMPWFYIMGAGLGMYGTAMYMNRNPQLLLGLLQGV